MIKSWRKLQYKTFMTYSALCVHAMNILVIEHTAVRLTQRAVKN